MAYTVKFEDGTSVNFDSMPSQADIDEVYAKIGKPKNNDPSILDRLGSGISATARTAGGLVGLATQLPYALGGVIASPYTGQSWDEIWKGSEQANPMTHVNEWSKPNELTQRGMNAHGELLGDAGVALGRLAKVPANLLGAGFTDEEYKKLQERGTPKGNLVDSKQWEAQKATPKEQDFYQKLEGAERSISENLGNFIPLGPAAKAGKGKTKAKNQEIANNLEAFARRKAEEEAGSPAKPLEGATIPYAEFEANLAAAKRARELQERARNTAIPLPDQFTDPSLPRIDPNLIEKRAGETPLPVLFGEPNPLAFGERPPEATLPKDALKAERATPDNLANIPPDAPAPGRFAAPERGQAPARPDTLPPVDSLAMRHDVPTIDFPLKTEHLNNDPMAQQVLRELDQRRWEASQMEVEKAKGGKKAADIAEAQRQTEARIAQLEQIAKDNGWTGWEQGSKGLFGFGKPTLAPIEKTKTLAGFGKKQRGSIEGMGNSFLLKAFDRFTKKAEAPESQHSKNVDLAQATKALPDQIANIYNGVDVPPADVKSFLEYAKDFIDNPKNDLTGFELRKGLTVSPGANLIAAGTKNPVLRWEYHQVDQAYKNAEHNIANLVQPQSKALQKLSPEDRNLFYTAVRVAEGKFDWTRAELVQAGIPDHVASIIEGLQTAGKTLWEKTNEALAATGHKPVPYRKGHFASTFIGSFRTLVKDKVTGDVKYVLSHNSRFLHDRATKALQKEFTTDKFKYEPLPYERNPHQFSRDADAGFRILLETLATDDPITKAISDAYGNWKATTAETYLGQHQHFKGKSKEAVGGAEGLRYGKELEQNAIDGVKAHIRFLENGFLWAEMDKANANVGKMLADSQLESKLPNTAKYVREYMEQAKGWRRNFLGKISDLIDDALGNEFMGKLGVGKNFMSNASRITRGAINAKLLDGPNFTFLAMQWLQTLNTMPEARSLTKIIQSPDWAVNKMVEGYEKITFSKDPFWVEVSDWARDKKISQSAIDIDTADIGASATRHKVATAWGAGRRFSEEQTRAITFGGFVNILKDHYPKDKALQMAADATERAMGDYRTFERAMLFESGGWIGKNMGYLQTYAFNAFGQLSRFYKNKDYNNLAALLGVLTFSSGLIGIIGIQQMEVIRDAWNYMFAAKTGSVLPSPKEALLKNSPDWLTFGGASAITGAGVSERMGFGQIAPQSISDLGMRGFSDLTKTAGSGLDVATNPTSPTAWKKFALDATPNSLKSIPEKMFYTSDKGEVISPTRNKKTGYTRSDADQVYRWLNVKSLAEAKHNIIEGQITLNEKDLQEFRGNLLQKWETSFFETDNKLKKGAITRDSAEIYRKLGGDPKDFLKLAQQRAIERQLTPAQQTYIGNSPLKTQRRLEYGNP